MFRSDLFYRLNVLPIQIPPLRERREDIPLAGGVLPPQALAGDEEADRPVSRDEAMELLLSYGWPGNVRELENAVERAVVFARDDKIRRGVARR